jgi:two-component system nitrogen regulation response regulator NtrX
MHLGLPLKTGLKSRTDDLDARMLLATAGLLGPSSRIKDVIRQIDNAARATAGVTIVGEEGTEGEIVARAIHSMGRPAGAPFVVIRCGASNPVRIEQDLFGTTDPTPTPGAGPDRVAVGALLHRARGGTALFLHLEELPDRVQARLAQVLRDREAILGGTDQPQGLDVWPMTTVAPAFQREVDEGRVRPALANRFAGSRIYLPTLRERREDIPALVLHYLERATAIGGAPARGISQPALALLCALEWTGNARELRSLIETISASDRTGEVGLDAVLEHLQRRGGGISRGLNLPVGATLRQARQQFEREFILAVLAQHHGRIPEAARSLGIQRTNLYRKMRTLRMARGPEHPTHD